MGGESVMTALRLTAEVNTPTLDSRKPTLLLPFRRQQAAANSWRAVS